MGRADVVRVVDVEVIAEVVSVFRDGGDGGAREAVREVFAHLVDLFGSRHLS